MWMMVPAAFVDSVIAGPGPHLSKGDILIDGGNSYYIDDIRRARQLEPSGIRYVDVGTSGGVWGLERGYCEMIGGPEEVVKHLDPIFKTLAPGRGRLPRTPGREKAGGTAEEGYLHCGPSGAGHFVKMVHNGIEYGMMQAFAEGFSLLRSKQEFGLDLAQVAELWRHSSVVRSWLLDLTADALAQDQELKDIAPVVADSGEGRWTALEAIEQGVPLPVITLALQMRFASQDSEGYPAKLLALMRNGFGGHNVEKR